MIKLIDLPEHQHLSVCLYSDSEGLFQLGERIHKRFEQADMNGYNWDALISFYVGQTDPELMQEINTDPEAGMFSAYMSHSPENLEKMKRFHAHVCKLLSDETALFKLIEDNLDHIEWD